MRVMVMRLVVAGILAFAGVAGAAQPVSLRIGSKRFTESYILAEIAVEAVRRAGGTTVFHEQGLGGTALVFRALEEGSIDAYPEYTGTIAEAILKIPGHADVATLRRELAPLGIAMTDSLGFDNTYAVAVSPKLAEARALTTLSDLAGDPDARLGFSPEFLGRSDGFAALAARYGISSGHVEALEHGLAYEAIARGSIDAMDVYSTDAKIERYRLKVLADDRRFFPSYEAVFLYRQDSARRAPDAMKAIGALAGTIDDSTMIRLNARAELDGWTFASVAAEFFRGGGPGVTHDASAGTSARKGRPSLLPGMLTVIRTEGPRHVGLVAASLFAAILVGVPFGVVASRNRTLGRVVLGGTSIVQTIPALALLCFFVPLLGTGVLPALGALFLYGLLPIVQNTVAGLDAIAPALRESAVALGLGREARLVLVEIPLASRSILAGIRTSAVIGVGGATLAAFVGAGGFGAPISTGLNLDDSTLILEGAIPAALLALVVEGVFTLLDRLVIPRGLRLPPEARAEGA